MNPVNKQKTTKKFMDWSRKSTDNEFGKHYPKSLRGRWGSFIAGRRHLLAVGKEAQLLQVAVLGVVEFGSPQPETFFFAAGAGVASEAERLAFFVRAMGERS